MTDPIAHASIDDYLGPGATRFFGEGYRRIAERLTDMSWDLERRTLRATAGVVFPFDWSVKQTTNPIAPHLSTIDAVVFAAQLADAGLTASLGLTAQQRRTMWLRRVDIRAGSTPDEQGLEAFPVDAKFSAPVDEPDSALGQVSTVVCHVGHMTVRCVVEHGRSDNDPMPTGPLPEGLLGAAERRPYGTGYQTHRQSITAMAVEVTGAVPRASATVVTSAEGSSGDEGMEGAYQPATSMVDAFVVALQMGQVLLYELDGLTRAASSTLWMRRTVLEVNAPQRPLGQHELVGAILDDAMVVESRGSTWRSADIVAESGGVRVRCSVTHKIPAASPARQPVQVG